ncbi:TIGR02206 family membrane protein [Lacinutrix sp.]|uniref:YwaF family protein n=1 Tax=Lacinutrix sp. TaxID=1937692 RepID=UPI00260EF26F|nr:TIGR02206 family membrane protein [Lacinutrix sp.]MDG1714426.1 TIGR02206 family membrane protein [Lacinutrix sp.]
MFSFISLFSLVEIGSLQHIIPIIITVILSIILIRFSNRKLNQKQQEQVFKALGFFVSYTVLVFHLHLIFKGNYNIATDLPLFLCSFMALFIFIFTNSRKYWLFEILLFWIIAGTSQAVVTPDIPFGFPSFDYFRYWIAHLGLLVIIFYAIFVLKMRPTWKSMFKSFLALQLYAIIIFGINYILNGNYFYLNKKPNSASALDYLGEWPIYLLTIEAILIPYFFIIYLPFFLTKKRK